MDTTGEEQLDFGDDDYGGAQKSQYQGSGAIPALADEDLMGEDDDYEDLYDGVNVGEGFRQFHRPDVGGSSNNLGNGTVQAQTTSNVPESRTESQNPGPILDQRYQNTGAGYPEQKGEVVSVKAPEMGSINHTSGMLASTQTGNHDTSSGGMGFQGSMSMTQRAPPVNPPNTSKPTNSGVPGPSAAHEMANNTMTTGTNVNVNHAADNIIRPQIENGPTMLFVGELHWWTTDAELESVLTQYGKVKEIKFFDERASGKSKGYCQVEFYDAAAAAACKEGMNGHVFNGRACVVAFASPQTLKQMGAAYANKNPPQQPQSQPPGRRNGNDGAGRGGGTNFPPGDGGRNYGRGGWGRGGGQGPGRGLGVGGPMGRGGPMGPRNTLGNAVGVNNGPVGNFGQGLGGPAFGGVPGGGMMHPQAMMGPGFDPTFMGRGAGYRGFSGPSFPGMMPAFPAVNPMGLAGVAPHINPAFFGRGMGPNGMGMMGSTGMEGHPGGLWGDPSMGVWGGGEEPGQKTRESSYGADDGASDYGYGDAPNPEKGARSGASQREKERAPERDRSGNSERRYRDERGQDFDRSDARDRRYREEKDSYKEHRRRERDAGYDDDWERGQSSSRPRSRSRAMVEEDDHRSRSRDVDYGKRRRAPSE